MLAPSMFNNLSSLFWDLKQSLQPPPAPINPDAALQRELDEEPPVPTKKARRKTLLERFRPIIRRRFSLRARKNTVVLPWSESPPKQLPESWFGTNRSRPVFALIIGIDQYQHLDPLQGCVNDADAFSQFIKSNLKGPADRVVELRNEQATRAGIQRAFHNLALRSGNTPQKDDAIVIYFAGYAGPWEGGFDGLQDLVPWDYNPSKDNLIPAITSHELLTALAGVKRTKGDHITIILDCGGSRKCVRQSEGGRIASRVVPLAEAPAELEHTSSEKNVISGNVFVLSAFSKGEAALECLGRGLFTTALIKLLSQEGSTNTTRFNILSRLPSIIGQTPQVHGGFIDAPIFDTGLVPPDRVGYHMSQEEGRYIVHAGSVAGIAPASRFCVYRDRSRLSKKKPGMFIADRISLFTTTLKPVDDKELKPLSNQPAAIPYGSGRRHDLVVHSVLKDALTPLYQVASKLLYETSPESYRFFFTDDKSKADISLDVCDDGSSLIIVLLDDRVRAHGFSEFPSTVPLNREDIEVFLLSAAHFYRYLNTNVNRPVLDGVLVEHVRLEESDTDYYDNGKAYRSPIGDNLVEQGIAEIVVDADDSGDYGIKITNHTDQELYAHVLYFDNSELSISAYHPGTMKPAPIKRDGGILTVGYGSPDATTYTYIIPEGRDIDVGFIKIIFSTEPLDLGAVVQISNTESDLKGGCNDDAVPQVQTQSMAAALETDAECIVGSMLFCVVQRRLVEED